MFNYALWCCVVCINEYMKLRTPHFSSSFTLRPQVLIYLIISDVMEKRVHESCALPVPFLRTSLQDDVLAYSVPGMQYLNYRGY